MKLKSYKVILIFGCLGLILILPFFLLSELTEEPNSELVQVSPRQRIKKADKPELYASLYNELRTKDGEISPSYP